jgi:hypothetical protein
MSELSRHQVQFKRLGRWYERFKNINDDQILDKSDEFYLDDVIAFFINCYHLKDWIKNDPAATSVADKVEAYINNNLELSLCADICTSMKHLEFNRNYLPRSGGKVSWNKKDVKLKVGSGERIIATKYRLDTKLGPRDAFDIATKCIEAWDKFYSDNNLKRD